MALDDFLKASATMGIEERITRGLIENMQKAMPVWMDLINDSFLSDEMKQSYIELVNRRISLLTGSL